MNQDKKFVKRGIQNIQEKNRPPEIIDLTSDIDEPPLKKQRQLPAQTQPISSQTKSTLPKPFGVLNRHNDSNGNFGPPDHQKYLHRPVEQASFASTSTIKRSSSTLPISPLVNASHPTSESLGEAVDVDHAKMLAMFTKLHVPKPIKFDTSPVDHNQRPTFMKRDPAIEAERQHPQSQSSQVPSRIPMVIVPAAQPASSKTDVRPIKQRRSSLITKLKQSPRIAQKNPDEVDKLVGRTGFSKAYAVNLEENLYQRAAPTRLRNVDRSTITLDFGADDKPPASTGKPKKSLVHPVQQTKAILIDRFGEPLTPPLTFSSDLSDQRLNGKFQFISRYMFRRGVKLLDKTSHLQSKCTCTGSCSIDCECLTKTLISVSKYGEKADKGRRAQIQPYQRLLNKNGLTILTDQFIHDQNSGDLERVAISECNERCGCDSTCLSKVVQKGRTVALEIFETERCGFGVRSSSDIVRGQFIDLYLGEVVTRSEIERREDAKAVGAPDYFYDLDFFPGQCYYVDGENFGSPMRYVNHSCKPNTQTFVVMNPYASEKLHYLAFFAIEDIPAGKEFTLDYQPQLAISAEGEQEQADISDIAMLDDDEVVKCLCGESNCRIRLWGLGKHTRSRKRMVGANDD